MEIVSDSSVNKEANNQIIFAEKDFWRDEYSKKIGRMLWDNSVYANKKIHSLLYKYLPKNDKFKILEIGCYPGSKLIFFKNKFDYSVYGVEMIKSSAERTKLNLKKYGVNGEIIHSDFFDKSFLENYLSYFDVILDFGFSEHFEDFDNIIQNYSKLLKPKRYVVIIIPNIGGIYKKCMPADLIKKHNLNIMNISTFEKAINKKFEKLFCGYVGGLYSDSSDESNLGLIIKNKHIRKLIIRLFKMLNKTMIHCKPPETKLFSPYLIYIGIKK
jgi:SAM-dependent methyltransferase